MPERERLLARTFVDVADTLVSDFDVVEFLSLLTIRCVELFDLGAAGLLLMSPSGGIEVAAASRPEHGAPRPLRAPPRRGTLR